MRRLYPFCCEESLRWKHLEPVIVSRTLSLRRIPPLQAPPLLRGEETESVLSHKPSRFIRFVVLSPFVFWGLDGEKNEKQRQTLPSWRTY